MTNRRKRIQLRGHDYLAALNLLVSMLKSAGDETKLDSTEMSLLTDAVERCGERGASQESAIEEIHSLAAYIIRSRRETLFPPFGDSDNMGDETIQPERLSA